jgi:hypothetical protein
VQAAVRDRDSEKPPLDLTGYALQALHPGVADSLVQKLAAAGAALVSSRKQEVGGLRLVRANRALLSARSSGIELI